MRRLAFLFVLLGLAACANPPAGSGDSAPAEIPPGNPPMGGPMPSRPGLSLDALLDPSADDEALRARLNAPMRTETEVVANRHVEGQTDTLRTLVYDGLALTFYEVTDGPTFLQEVTVTERGIETAEGLGVGSTREAVESVYTPSVGAEGATVTYERPDGAPTPTLLRVTYDGDRTTSLTWVFYVD